MLKRSTVRVRDLVNSLAHALSIANHNEECLMRLAASEASTKQTRSEALGAQAVFGNAAAALRDLIGETSAATSLPRGSN